MLARSAAAVNIAKVRGISWRGQRQFAERLIDTRIRSFVARGVIQKQSRFSASHRRERPGYVISVGNQLTVADRILLRSILVRWDDYDPGGAR